MGVQSAFAHEADKCLCKNKSRKGICGVLTGVYMGSRSVSSNVKAKENLESSSSVSRRRHLALLSYIGQETLQCSTEGCWWPSFPGWCIQESMLFLFCWPGS